jgi:hypothetical protein
MIDTTVTVKEESSDVLFKHVTGAASVTGYTASSAAPGTLTLSRRVTPDWAIVVAVVGGVLCVLNLALAPSFVTLIWAGLAFCLLAKSTETTTLIATDRDGATEIRVMGVGTSEVISLLGAAGITDSGLVAQVEQASPAARRAPGSGGKPTWILLAVAVSLCLGLVAGGYFLTRGSTDSRPYVRIHRGTGVEGVVSGRVGQDVTCEYVGDGSLGPVSRCTPNDMDDTTVSCWVVVDSSNMTGEGLRRAQGRDRASGCR